MRGVLANATTNAAKGTHQRPRSRASPSQANDQLTKAEQYDDVILAYRNGAPVRVRDVGHAVDGPQNVNIAGAGRQRQARP